MESVSKPLIFLVVSISFVVQNLLTSAFGGQCSIQLSYGSAAGRTIPDGAFSCNAAGAAAIRWSNSEERAVLAGRTVEQVSPNKEISEECRPMSQFGRADR